MWWFMSDKVQKERDKYTLLTAQLESLKKLRELERKELEERNNRLSEEADKRFKEQAKKYNQELKNAREQLKEMDLNNSTCRLSDDIYRLLDNTSGAYPTDSRVP